MKKNTKIFFTTVFTLSLLLFSSPISAQEPFLIEGEVVVSSTCQVTDTDNKLHVFPKETSPSGLLGICAIVAAKDAGIIESFAFIDFGFGLFLNAINGVATSPDWDLSWSLYHNEEFAMVGLADLAVKAGDSLSLIYTSFSSGQKFDKLLLKITLSPESRPGNVLTGSGAIAEHSFSAENAVQFLSAMQRPDGSIENPMFTDWAAIAFGAANADEEAVTALKNYLTQNTNPGQSLGSPVLSFIRRAMALMALGINPYSGTAVNYVEKIIESFDGSQIGDPKLVNDDIFALLVLSKAGYNSSDEIVLKTVQFILSEQKPDGSFAGGVDMASAAIQALSLVSDIEGVPAAIDKAKTYILSQQQQDGGFGNAEATSWTMQAIAALGEDWRDWKKNNNSPGSYLFYFQRQDGSLLSPTPVWSTAYAVPAALSKPWGMILNSFSKEKADSFAELEKISQELAQVKEQALALEAKISLLAQAEAQALAKEQQEKEELALKETAVLSASQDTAFTAKTLGAQIGTAARQALPYGVAATVLILVTYLLIMSGFGKLWKSS